MSGQLWAGVNSVLGCHYRKQTSIDTSLSVDSVNDFFRTVAVTDNHQPASTFCQVEAESDSSFHFCEVDRSVVLCLLQNLEVCGTGWYFCSISQGDGSRGCGPLNCVVQQILEN